MSRSAKVISLVACVCALCALGCEDPLVAGGPAAGRGLGASPAPARPAATETPDADAAPQGEDTPLAYRDEDFVELDTSNRDPFRGFQHIFKARAVHNEVTRRVLLPTTAIDEMRLIAIVSGVAQPRAMLQDPSSVGHVVKRGDYIGRPEVIQTGGSDSMPVTLNWRVARIRPGEIVLTREDPTAPDRPPLTRIIPLHEEGDPSLAARE